LQGYSEIEVKPCKMLGKTEKTSQLNMYQVPLIHFINKDHELCQLAERIDWDGLERDLSDYYCIDNGRPSIPIRKIVGVILLKRMFNESDESVVDRWKENPYWQYFCGEVNFQHNWPFDPTELIKFRQRMGESGMERILKVSIDLFDRKEIQEKHVLIDTTVQEKNITYPTDPKLQKRIVEKCRAIAKDEGITLRQSYKRIFKQLMIDQRFREHPKRKKRANAAARKIKVIAGRVVRDLERKMNPEQLARYEQELLLYYRVINQERTDSNKIYSLHEPEVKCIAKGKEAKKYEFGNKSSIAKTMKSGIIVGAMGYKDNLYDADTLEPQLEQIERLTGQLPETSVVDRGYRGRKTVFGVEIRIPCKPKKDATNYEKQKARRFFKARAGIEPVIGHVKHDHRMSRNYLSGTQGDMINTLLAAAGFNMMKMLRRIKAKSLDLCHYFKWKIDRYLNLIISDRENQWVFQA
jgi:transposase, IS5 family